MIIQLFMETANAVQTHKAHVSVDFYRSLTGLISYICVGKSFCARVSGHRTEIIYNNR